MKRFLLLFVFFISAFFMNAEKLVKIPEMEELFSYLGIEVPSKTVRQYVVTDRKNGVYLGQTFNSRSGDYKINDANSYKDFTIYQDGNYLDVKDALNCTVYPYGIVYNYPGNVQTTFMLLQNETGVLLSVKGEQGKKYSLVPSIVMAKKAESLTFEDSAADQMVIISSSEDKNAIKYAAVLYADSSYEKMVTEKDANAPQGGLISTGIYAGKYEASGNVNLILLFDTDKDNLVKKAREYSKQYKALENKTKLFFYDMLSRCYVKTGNDLYNKALAWSILSANTMINTKYSGTGIYAGFPWFQQNWGRDTFISLPGTSLVSGRFDEAKAVLKTFSDYQHKNPEKEMYGRIPNRIMDKSIIYNTTDGTPWMIREAYEYLQYTNDTDYAKAMFQVAKLAIEGAEKNFVDNEGLLTHDDADTWMDARISGRQPWSPRGNRAVEIQALWYNQLLVSANLAELVGEKELATQWRGKAGNVKKVFNAKYWNEKSKMLFDRIAENNKPDGRVRPNQLMAITVPFAPLIDGERSALLVKNSISRLLVPYGILSLDAKDPYFHPYHENNMYHKDSAYHNGTIWGWNAGLAVNALTDFSYQDFAFDFSLNLADQIVNQGCVGSMSENMDAMPGKDGKVKLTGTYSQAWSVAEFARVFYQNYAGIKPALLTGKITINPKFGKKMGTVETTQKLGDGYLYLSFDGETYKLQLENLGSKSIDFIFTDETGAEWKCSFTGESGNVYTLSGNAGKYLLDNKEITVTLNKDSYKKTIGELKFAPAKVGKVPVLKKENLLKDQILNNKYKF